MNAERSPHAGISTGNRWIAGIVLTLIGALGVLHAHFPLSGDAALYQAGARAMAQGTALYSEYWDLKQPGVYWFHLFAGTVFGFGDVGLRLTELGILLALSAALMLRLRRLIEPAWLVALSPLASVATYYVVATEWHLTQPAVLASAPLFVLLALIGESRVEPRRWFIAGVFGAVAMSFGHYAGFIAVSVAMGALVLARWIERDNVSRLMLAGALPFAVGMASAAALMLAWLVSTGALDAYLWTQFEWRGLALEVRGRPSLGHAVFSSLWFLRSFWPWLLVSPFALLDWRGLVHERLFVLALVWLAIGWLATAFEPFAAWEFDYLKLMVPVSILAVRGSQGLLSQLRLRSRIYGQALSVALAVLVLLAAVSVTDKLTPSWNVLRSTDMQGKSFQQRVSPRYDSWWQSTAFLRQPTAKPGAVYVFGDPIAQLFAERPRASAIHGWAWELQPKEMWTALESDLVQSRPAFIFVARDYEALISERGASIRDLLDGWYQSRGDESAGRWYERRDAVADWPSPIAVPGFGQ